MSSKWGRPRTRKRWYDCCSGQGAGMVARRGRYHSRTQLTPRQVSSRKLFIIQNRYVWNISELRAVLVLKI